MDIYKNLLLENLDGEIWKNIEEFPDYQISNLGRVKSFKKWCGTDKRILKQGKDKKGYLFVILYKNKTKNPKKVHHLVYESFYEKLKENECVHHLDENKENNILNNLQKIIISDHNKFHNSIEKHPRGMFGKHHSEKTKKLLNKKNLGEDNPNVKLTEQKVIEIWKYLDERILTQKEIAEIFGITRQTISDIKNRKSWKHVK